MTGDSRAPQIQIIPDPNHPEQVPSLQYFGEEKIQYLVPVSGTSPPTQYMVITQSGPTTRTGSTGQPGYSTTSQTGSTPATQTGFSINSKPNIASALRQAANPTCRPVPTLPSTVRSNTVQYGSQHTVQSISTPNGTVQLICRPASNMQPRQGPSQASKPVQGGETTITPVPLELTSNPPATSNPSASSNPPASTPHCSNPLSRPPALNTQMEYKQNTSGKCHCQVSNSLYSYSINICVTLFVLKLGMSKLLFKDCSNYLAQVALDCISCVSFVILHTSRHIKEKNA